MPTPARLLDNKERVPAAAGAKGPFAKERPLSSVRELQHTVLPVWSATGPAVVRLMKEYPDRIMFYDGKKISKIVKGLYTTKPHPKPTEAEVTQFHADIRKDAKTDGNIDDFIKRHPLPSVC